MTAKKNQDRELIVRDWAESGIFADRQIEIKNLRAVTGLLRVPFAAWMGAGSCRAVKKRKAQGCTACICFLLTRMLA